MMPRDRATASDDELRDEARLRGWERHVVPLGCLLPLGLGAIALVLGGSTGGRGMARTVGAAGAAFLLVGLGLRKVVVRRHGPARAELLRRYTLAIDPERMKGADAPDWTILLHDRALPHGGLSSSRVELWAGPPARGHLEVRCVRHTSGLIEEATLSQATRALAAERAAALLECLEREALALEHVPAHVRDGNPCAVTVVAHGLPTIHEGSANLAGVDAAQEPLQTVRLIRAVRDATQ